MRVIEVVDKKQAKAFLKLPVRLYKDNPKWIRPLDEDIAAVFDPKKNKNFNSGNCIRWILQDESGLTIGRIAAFVNKKTANKDNDQPTGGVGFFECIDNQEAANLLFETAKSWLTDQGMEAMDGPINFGDRDKWWGLLVDGFDLEPNYCSNYHFPYYQALFEAYGFQTYFKQFTFGRYILRELSPRLVEKSERVLKDPRYTVRHLQIAEIDKYTEDFREVYNKAWASHKGVPKMSSLLAKATIKKMKPIMDPKLLWFAYFEEKPIGFFIMVPEVNQIFKHLNGKLDWIGKAIFLWHKWRKTNNKALGVIFGIDPEHQGKGVDGAIIRVTNDSLNSHRAYENIEMNWIGDFNPKMINLVKRQVEGEVVKTHITYRKLFDETKPFSRMPMKDVGLR